MLITYRRTAGLLAVLTVATVTLAVTVLTIAVAATLAVAIAAIALVGRAVLPRAWRNRTVPSAMPWSHKTIDATVVDATRSSATPNLPRMEYNSR